MLAESIIRIGRPISNSPALPVKERIRLLTDVESENCKNFFQNVLIIELGNEEDALSYVKVGEMSADKKTFVVNTNQSTAFPIQYPNGGNPRNAQGIYPIPCYLMYDAHIKAMAEKGQFFQAVLPRLKQTVGYSQFGIEEIETVASRVSEILEAHRTEFIMEEKQLGILMIFDERLPVYMKLNEKTDHGDDLWIRESRLVPGTHLYLNGQEALKSIIDAKFDEASTLGKAEHAVSTFTNKETEEVVSIYNKSWLWLSPTWDMPKSIYWGEDEWTKGIKVDKKSYESYLYGSQFLKKIQVPISNAVLKEMFSPISSVEAKKHMRAGSFEQIFGIPMVLPLLDEDSEQYYQKFLRLLRTNQDLKEEDLHLELLAGMKQSIVPRSSDQYRLTILYYSGDLSRGSMHVRAVIEDVIPSVAYEVQNIIKQLRRRHLGQIQKVFDLEQRPFFRVESLPSLLANAYGPGYVWSTMQAVLHREPLTLERAVSATAKRLNELANKESYWEMKQELVFFYSFLFFLNCYNEKILAKGKDVKELADWKAMIEKYHAGLVELEDLQNAETLGFVSGLLLKQFSNSYYKKTDKDYLKHRVMKFGSKLTSEMIWKYGTLRCEELAQQWNLNISKNFYAVLAQVLLGFIEADKENLLISQNDAFMTAFWSGYLSYKSNKKQEGEEINAGA
ncbi:hypothetical protein [Heyndrickxia coagulans]|uniref:hypothetical protein n=1 Tax=Heyndrickxia coagulans TaxID=1398 RepID=UPI0006287FB1|nr:hypothetical protein [Heyndrickxia coagulans]